MGQESLERLSIEKYLIQWEKGLREETDKQYLKDHFMIGCGENENKVRFYKLYLKIFCNDNCELSNWIWKKINGLMEDKEKCTKGEIDELRYQPVCNIMNVYNKYEWSERAW